ncbi:MAG: hypothetical protein ABIY55_29515, partial [Kofleriaceae bacterium]
MEIITSAAKGEGESGPKHRVAIDDQDLERSRGAHEASSKLAAVRGFRIAARLTASFMAFGFMRSVDVHWPRHHPRSDRPGSRPLHSPITPAAVKQANGATIAGSPQATVAHAPITLPVTNATNIVRSSTVRGSCGASAFSAPTTRRRPVA